MMRRAAEINSGAAVNFNALGDALMTAGRYDEAIEPLRQALRLNPQYDMALERLEIACHRGGREEDASVARRSLLAHHGQSERLALLEEGIEQDRLDRRARGGCPARARAAARTGDIGGSVHRCELEPATIRPHLVAYAELGEWKSAMDWVERGYHRRPGRLRRVLTDFLFDRRGLAIDPRYAPLLRTAGLESLL